jgi:two-component system cell cycle response regulator DivK
MPRGDERSARGEPRCPANPDSSPDSAPDRTRALARIIGTTGKEGAVAKLLLVDDNEMNLDMLARRLQMRGYAVVCAADGIQGIAKAQSDLPDLILMDMSMPVMNGWDATRKLREIPQTQAIPVVALTSHNMKGDHEKALQAGCSAFVPKPVDIDNLQQIIQKLLQKVARP